jgi:hypothetical protein
LQFLLEALNFSADRQKSWSCIHLSPGCSECSARTHWLSPTRFPGFGSFNGTAATVNGYFTLYMDNFD